MQLNIEQDASKSEHLTGLFLRDPSLLKILLFAYAAAYMCNITVKVFGLVGHKTRLDCNAQGLALKTAALEQWLLNI